jgi:hypothetical protein
MTGLADSLFNQEKIGFPTMRDKIYETAPRIVTIAGASSSGALSLVI